MHYLYGEKDFSACGDGISYLGFLFIRNARCTTQLNSVLTKFESKISNRKVKPLSQAGRITMVKSILLSLPIYLMSCYKFPKRLCAKLQPCTSRFLQCHGNAKHTIHWDSWINLYRRKSEGGIGLRDLSMFNQTMIAKTKWKIVTDSTFFLATVLKHKYFPNCSFLDVFEGRNPSFL